jgi:hypothetical protein
MKRTDCKVENHRSFGYIANRRARGLLNLCRGRHRMRREEFQQLSNRSSCAFTHGQHMQTETYALRNVPRVKVLIDEPGQMSVKVKGKELIRTSYCQRNVSYSKTRIHRICPPVTASAASTTLRVQHHCALVQHGGGGARVVND